MKAPPALVRARRILLGLLVTLGLTTRGWRATFYTTGMEHSPTSATGTG